MDGFKQRLKDIELNGERRQLSLPEGLSFYHNDYLGLSTYSPIIEAGHIALDVYGAGSTGSRLLGGHSRVFEEVEEDVAEFFGAPSALFFSSGYLANLGLITSLAPSFGRVLSDELNHASIVDALRLARTQKVIVKHNEWSNVAATSSDLIVTEGLFSMEGDFLDWDCVSSKKAFIVVDQAHSAGLFFENGKGLALPWNRAASVVTFGKAFGVAGACVLSSLEVRELLINQARSFIFSTATAPVVPAMVIASIRVLQKEAWRREALWELAEEVRRILQPILGRAPNVWADRSPILSIPIPGADRALKFCEDIRKMGIDLKAIRYPTVPRGRERIRLSLGLSVTRDNTLMMADELVRQWKALL